MSRDASTPGSPGLAAAAAGPVTECRDIRYVYSENLPSVLASLHGSLVISTHTTGNIVVVSAPQGQLDVSFHTFERPMGMAIRPGWLVVGTRTQIWSLRSFPDLASRVKPSGRFDACYLTRFSHFTGNIQCHELAWVAPGFGASEQGALAGGGVPELWIVNTLFSCLCAAHAAYSFAPRWRPPFVSVLAPEDRCHLNGLAVQDGKPRYVTALAETDSAQGWRARKVGGGCVVDVVSNQTVIRGLTMPHSPRLTGDRLLVLHSGLGQLVMAEPRTGRVETIAELPGYTRGLAIDGPLAFVGLSNVRTTSSMDGVPIAAQPERLRCGFAVVDLRTGQVIADLDFAAGIDEIFDIQILPGSSAPFLSGPFADRGLVPSVWTMPPGS
ncbi:MAG TPA: TIGR03032 family protein [Gemmataceae bacterium]|nr:TIGR03032 family protein [Gemmataceae bacterium]